MLILSQFALDLEIDISAFCGLRTFRSLRFDYANSFSPSVFLDALDSYHNHNRIQ